jgi:flagellar export protein FliJ
MWESRERYERRKLEALAARVGALRAQIRRIEQGGLVARRAAGARMGAGVAAAELHFAAVCEESRREALAELLERLTAAENERVAQMTVYQGVERQCKILENLRRRQYDVFRIEETRREQKRLDEIFLLGRGAGEKAAGPESR